MAFSHKAVWSDTLALLRAHAGALAAIAGLLLFLPSMLVTYTLPPLPETADSAGLLAGLVDSYRRTAPWIAFEFLLGQVGMAAMLRLVLARHAGLGGAIGFGLIVLPFYALMSVLTIVIILLGSLLLIVPGLYAIGRLVPAGPIMAAEGRRDPLAAIERSVAITEGHGWAVFGLALLVYAAGMIALGVAGRLADMMFAAWQWRGALLGATLEAALNAALVTVEMVLYAAIYRALAPSASHATTFD